MERDERGRKEEEGDDRGTGLRKTGSPGDISRGHRIEQCTATSQKGGKRRRKRRMTLKH